MRVAIFTPYLYPFYVQMVEALSRLRVFEEVKLFTTGIYGNYPFEKLLSSAEKLSSHAILGQRILTIRSMVRFTSFKPHLVILFGIEGIPALMLYFVSKLIRAKIIAVVEENYITIEKSAVRRFLSLLKRQIVKYVYRNADILVAESKASANYVSQVLRVKRSKPIYVEPHGINTEKFIKYRKLENTNAKALIIEKYLLPKEIFDKTWVSFIGEPSYIKGFDVLVDAIDILKDIPLKNNYVFLIPKNLPLLRDFPHLKGVYLRKVAKLVHDNIAVLYPNISYEDMPIFYRASDVIVLPSRLMKETSSDRSPNVAMEAIASGRILVASYVGGIPDVTRGVGFFVKPNDPKILAETLARILNDVKKYEAVMEDMTMKVMRHLDVKLYILKVLKLALQAS